jgi:inorganic pyrophosphatase
MSGGFGKEKMDTTRWKSILVPREVYEEIKELSKAEGRTIGGQLRLVFEWYKDSRGKGNEPKNSREGGSPQPAE